MVHPSRQFNKAGADRGEIERQRQRELIESAGGWFAYFKGQRRRREQAEARDNTQKRRYKCEDIR